MPLHIHELLSAYQPTVALRSIGQNRLAVPITLNLFLIVLNCFNAVVDIMVL